MAALSFQRGFRRMVNAVLKAYGSLCRTKMRLFGTTVVPRSCTVRGCPNMWFHEGTLRCGERVELLSLPAAYPKGMPFGCCFETAPGATVTIGDGTILAGTVLSARERIDIGKNVMIGGGTRIMDNDGHPVDGPTHREGSLDAPAPIVIEDDVWIAMDVTVLKGVRIGKGSVIGTRSVVTRDIPPGVLAAGAPATVIRPLEGRKTA